MRSELAVSGQDISELAVSGLGADPHGATPQTQAAQLGFYGHIGERVGDFEALLFRNADGNPESMLQDLVDFFRTYPLHVSPKPGTTAARLVWYLLQEKRYENIGVHQSLKPDIRFFYKIGLQQGGHIEVFEIPQMLEISQHPTKGPIVWAQSQRQPGSWHKQVHPSQWRLLQRQGLDLGNL